MAHEVQIGSSRFKVREPLAVFVLGIVTCGFYITYWWIRSAKDLEQFDREQLKGRVGVSSSAHVRLAIAGTASYALREGISFVEGYKAGRAEALARQAGASAQQVAAAGHAAHGGGLTAFAAVLSLVTFVSYVLAAIRMRRDVRMTMSSIGMLPEEMTPGTASYVASCVVLGILGSASANQASLKAIWARYPRYFASIGGTREDIAAATALLAPTGATQALTQALPHNVTALPVRGVAMPASMPGFSPPPAGAAAPPNLQLVQSVQQVQPLQAVQPVQPQLSPAAQRMTELEPGALAGSLSHAEAYEYAQASEQVHGAEAAAPWYAYVVRTDPSNALAAFWYGVYQLGKNDDCGVATLHRTLADERTATFARQRIVAYLEAHGRHAEAARYASAEGAAQAA